MIAQTNATAERSTSRRDRLFSPLQIYDETFQHLCQYLQACGGSRPPGSEPANIKEDDAAYGMYEEAHHPQWNDL